MRKTLTALALMTGIVTPAGALVVSLDSTSASGPNTVFNYSVALASDEAFNSSSIFAIFDFAGYVAGSIAAPTGFTASVENSSGLPPLFGSGTSDDPAVGNLVFRATGPLTGFEFTGFSAATTLTGTTNDGFSGVTTKTGGAGTGTFVGSQGIVAVPAAVTGVIPEPATWGMMLLGFGMVGVASRRRRRTAHVLG